MKNENKKMEKMKNYYSEKKPTKISWPMSVKSDQRKILFKNKTSTKQPWPMSAKPETQLPGFIYNEIRIFWIASKNFSP